MEGNNAHRAMEAKTLCIQMNHQFVASLVTMEKLLLVTKKLSDHLQSPELQLASAEDFVQSVVFTLSDMRTEDAWKELEGAVEKYV